jgi:hypothetical protein
MSLNKAIGIKLTRTGSGVTASLRLAGIGGKALVYGWVLSTVVALKSAFDLSPSISSKRQAVERKPL